MPVWRIRSLNGYLNGSIRILLFGDWGVAERVGRELLFKRQGIIHCILLYCGDLHGDFWWVSSRKDKPVRCICEAVS